MQRTPCQGFTLIEMVIYVAVVSAIVVSMVEVSYMARDSRNRAIVLTTVHGATATVLNTIDFLVRNADGFVTDSNGNDCTFYNKVWLKFSTTSAAMLPPGCTGDYASAAVSVEGYRFPGFVSHDVGASFKIKDDGDYVYVLTGSIPFGRYIEKRSKGELMLAPDFGVDGVLTVDWDVYDIVLDPPYVYLIGNTPAGVQDGYYQIEKRLLTTGDLCTASLCGTEFGTGGTMINTAAKGAAYSGFVYGSYLYTIGSLYPGNYQGRIERRLKTTGELDTNFAGSGAVQTVFISVPRAVVTDGTYMYVAGGSPMVTAKYYLSNGDLDTGYGALGRTTENTGTATHYDLDQDDTYVYAIGETNYTCQGEFPFITCNGRDVVIQKIRKSDGAYCDGSADKCGGVEFGNGDGIYWDTSGLGGFDHIFGYGIDVHDGYIYYAANKSLNEIGAVWGKRSTIDGSLVAEFGGDGEIVNDLYSAYEILIDPPYMFTGGYDGNTLGMMEKRYLSDGLLEERHGIRMLCYQDYPNAGPVTDCNSSPPHNGLARFDVIDPYHLYTSPEDIVVSTTTVGAQDAVSFQISIGRRSNDLFRFNTSTASTTATFRIAP